MIDGPRISTRCVTAVVHVVPPAMGAGCKTLAAAGPTTSTFRAVRRSPGTGTGSVWVDVGGHGLRVVPVFAEQPLHVRRTAPQLVQELSGLAAGAVKLAWDALLTLADYVRARNERKWDLGVPQYLASTPQGFRSVGPSKFAEGETALTMDAYGATRIFPVPTSADPSGRATMQAPFKLGKIGRISPRMHVIDCWPTDGRVYVGYIGPHLPTARG